jgi:hypothetical protein
MARFVGRPPLNYADRVLVPNWDEVLTLLTATGIGTVFSRLGVTVGVLRDHRYKDALDVAQWLAPDISEDNAPGRRRLAALKESLEGLDVEAAARSETALQADETQAALQELIVARLSNQPELYAGQARDGLRDTLIAVEPDIGPVAEAIARHFDSEFRLIAARLRSRKPEIMRQIGSNAQSAQMMIILRSIERRVACLQSRPGDNFEREFLTNYRRHVLADNGTIPLANVDYNPVKFDDIYVPTPLREFSYPAGVGAPSEFTASLNLEDLARHVHRAVVLGDPGNGKTTAARWLMHHFASLLPEDSKAGRVPFLIRLHDYADAGIPARSIVGHIEENIRNHFQEEDIPAGMVDFLLFNNRAIVIFDGLDEVLDVQDRRVIASRIDHFCVTYPQARVLVTARIAGYSQARPEDPEFLHYRLSAFGEKEVARYAAKWFALVPDARPGDADAFIAESVSVPDLRSNPLLLSLLCTLYRGRGSLPRRRTRLYDKCVDLLIEKWDTQRHIYPNLRTGDIIQETLQCLAWWLYTRKEKEREVSESELISETTTFLRRKVFYTITEARDAATEFVRFCRGRAWIFTESGRNEDREPVYSFTHPTFLDYFAAASLAYQNSNGPESLANVLMRHVPRDEWWDMGELAIQLKNESSPNGANRIYKKMLQASDALPPEEREATVRFLVFCLRSSAGSISERNLRSLVRSFLTERLSVQRTEGSSQGWMRALHEMLDTARNTTIADELSKVAAELLGTGDEASAENTLWFAASLRNSNIVPQVLTDTPFWVNVMNDLIAAHAADVITVTEEVPYVRHTALELGVMATSRALEMPGGLSALLRTPGSYFPQDIKAVPFLGRVCDALTTGSEKVGDSQVAVATVLESVGEYLLVHPGLPWVRGEIDHTLDPGPVEAGPDGAGAALSPAAYLGGAALLAIVAERGPAGKRKPFLDAPPAGLTRDLAPYLARRLRPDAAAVLPPLPDLPVPARFQQVFRDWADGRVDLTAREDA